MKHTVSNPKCMRWILLFAAFATSCATAAPGRASPPSEPHTGPVHAPAGGAGGAPPARPGGGPDPVPRFPVDLAGGDAEAAARAIALVIDAAYHRADPALVDAVLDAGCACHTRVATLVRQFAARGEREVDTNYRVVRTQLISMLETGEAVVRVVHEQGPVIIEDTAGRRRSEPGWPLQRCIYYLRREGGRWIVVDMEHEGMGDVA